MFPSGVKPKKTNPGWLLGISPKGLMVLRMKPIAKVTLLKIVGNVYEN